MSRTATLAEYVKKRNGVALGAPGSMRNMLERSLGAGSFVLFWRYWNPIWGYYLSRKVMKPLSRFLPVWLAILLTFAVSGALHDLAISLAKGQWTLLFTPWFFLMGVIILVSGRLAISYHAQPWLIRATINSTLIAGSLLVTRQWVEML